MKRQAQSSQTISDKTTIKLLQGRDGRDGAPGSKEDRGSKGDQGPPGPKGEGRDGRDAHDGVQGIKGDIGPHGDKGDQGLTGSKGYQGSTGSKGEPAGGLVYVRWGHDCCPSTGAKLVYSGRAGGPAQYQKGGGSNPQCLPLEPNYLKYQTGSQSAYSYMYGAEYQWTNPLVPNTDDVDVPCAVCYVPTRTALYMIPAQYTCPNGWTTEYYGYLIGEYQNHYRSQYSCVDVAMKKVAESIANLL